MTWCPPTVSDFKGYFRRDFPYAVPSFGASGRASVAGGSVTDIDPIDGGEQYTEAPTVVLESVDGNGTGAKAIAIIDEDTQKVVDFQVTAPGTGYTIPPCVLITGGSGDDSDDTMVQDHDLTKARGETRLNFNRSLWANDEHAQIPFLYLMAHYLVMDIQMSGQGLASQGNWILTGKSVGSVAAQFGVPDRILKSPQMAYFSKTQYGMKYLSLLYPRLIGNMSSIPGRSWP